MTRAQSGFTLVETLVALVIAGLVSYLVFNTLQISSDSSRRLSNHIGQYHELKRAQDWFRLSVGNVIAQQNFQPHFQGQPTAFTAYSSYSITRSYNSLIPVTWRIESSEGQHTLYLNEGTESEGIIVYQWQNDDAAPEFVYLNANLEVVREWSSESAYYALPHAVALTSDDATTFMLVRIWAEKTPPIDLGGF